jgi:hypothetical protein
MSTSPLVTVVMPVHNAEPFVEAAIGSVLAQTLSDFELIVVDDASTDASAGKVRGFEDPRIRRLELGRNLGPSAARNTGVGEARGRYVAFLDADDIARPHRLARQVLFFERHPEAEMVGGAVACIDAAGAGTGKTWHPDTHPERLPVLLYFHNAFYTSTLMVRTGLARRLPFRADLAAAEDYEFNVRVARAAPVANLPDVLADYRLNACGLSATRAASMEECVREVMRVQLERLGLKPSARERELHFHLNAFHLAPSLALLDEIDAWLYTLRQALYGTPRPRTAIDAVLAGKWFEACRCASGLGPAVVGRYRAGAVRGNRAVPWTRLAKMAARAALRIDRRP